MSFTGSLKADYPFYFLLPALFPGYNGLDIKMAILVQVIGIQV